MGVDAQPREALAHSGIGGTWHRYGALDWFEGSPESEYNSDYDRPLCPVSECASVEGPCKLIAERITDHDGRGAWRCPHHGQFRVFDWPRDESSTEQSTLFDVGGDQR